MRTILICVLVFGLGTVRLIQAQPVSPFTVRYLVTHDAAAKQFTAWVVPDYDTPNSNNPDTDERGITAQFSLKVPRSFVITQLTDLRGNWDKKPVKIDPRQHLGQSATDDFTYYMIGKSPVETSYGGFRQGEPVALFTFRGQGNDPGQVQALTVNDPVVALLDREMSLNIRGSFYSRSGQDFKPHTRPMEQFVRVTSLSAVLREAQQKETAAAQASGEEPTGNLLVYPNPVQQVLTIKYFSEKDQVPAVVEWIDLRGVVQQTKQTVAKQGLNSLQLNVGMSAGGTYFLRTTIDGKATTGKMLKL